MASTLIHMCIAKKINQVLNYPENMLFLGTVAPDISKRVGETRERSHFLTDKENVDIDAFLKKYQKDIKNPFIMGYFIHLYVDLFWEKYFMGEIVLKNSIVLMDGSKVEATEDNYRKLIYNDYTNLNIQLLDLYDLDLSLFYNEPILPDIKMDEIPIEKLYLLLDYSSVIIENTKERKAYVFNIENIKVFIETTSQLILSIIEEMLLEK